MNSLLQCFASGTWEHLVRALLHTLWEGAAIVLVLCLCLRLATNPLARYRLCFLALCSVLMAGLVTWAVLDVSPKAVVALAPSPAQVSTSPGLAAASTLSAPASVRGPGQPALQVPGNRAWTARLAVVWLAGLVLMLARATWAVAGARQLRSGARPLANEAILRLVRDAQSRLGLVRQIRVVVTEKLTSPAVAGVLVPTLVLPLSLTTTLSLSQLQLIVLHELAHIRRRDYLANLFQLLLESLLFFNPAVWWLSRQVRQEREACCDALAVALAAGERVEYARALAEVAERSLESGFTSAPAFSAPAHGSGLKDRIQRLLVPGYRPGLRLSWQGLAGSLVCGSVVLMLSALGTQWTVKAAVQILTPQQRIERIETNLKSLGHDPEAFAQEGDDQPVEVRAVVRTRDGSPLPRSRYVSFMSRYQGGIRSSVTHNSFDQQGRCQTTLPRGELYLWACLDGFAPAYLGPIDIRKTNPVAPLELVLERGFPISIHAIDENSGRPLPNASLECCFFNPQNSSNVGNARNLTTDQTGMASLLNCASLPLHVTVKLDGYEAVEKVFAQLHPNDTLQVSTRRSLPIAGRVSEQKTGQPVAGALLYVVSALEAPGVATCDPWNPVGEPLAQTDSQGRFAIDRLPRSGRYWLLVRAPGLSGMVLPDVRAGQTNLSAVLRPEMLVKGRLTGDLSLLTRKSGKQVLNSDYQIVREGAGSSGYGHYVPVRFEDGVGFFEYTNVVAGPATVSVGNWHFTTNTSSSIEDWLIRMPDTGMARTRKVVLRFERPSGVPPKGTIKALLPEAAGYSVYKELEIQDGEAHLEVPVGKSFSFEPAHTVGYWFEAQPNVQVEEAPAPLVLNVPVVPAGAIYAEAFRAQATVAGEVFFQVVELKKSTRTSYGLHGIFDSGSTLAKGSSDTFVASSLPLDGTYRIVAHRGNNFCSSEPIALTEQAPDRKVELRFRPGLRLEGQVLSAAGRPVSHASVEMTCQFENHGFGSAPVKSDDDGRFCFEDCQPGGGIFRVTIHAAPGLRSVQMPIDLGKLPLVVRLAPGLKLSGRVLDAQSAQPVPSVEVRAWNDTGSVPTEVTRTDAEGRFEFSTLSDVPYRLYTQGSNMPEGRPGSSAPVILKVAAGSP